MSASHDFSLNLKQVKTVKILLVVGLFLCVVTPVFFSVIRKSSDRERFSDYMKTLGAIPSDMSFANGVYETVTDEGERVVLQAQGGKAENYKAEKIFFDRPMLTRYEEAGKSVLRAEAGRFDRKDGRILLTDEAGLELHKNGVKIRTSEIMYDFRSGKATVKSEINASGENANFKAGRARIDTESKKAYFDGGVRVIFSPE